MAIKGKNPKDAIGEKKVSITKLPMVAVVHGAAAMTNGADKYGPFNWRENDVVAHIYIDAAMRHLMDWFEGEETADDSGVHHLGHAIACCAILLDAQANGNLIDDRPGSQKDPGWFSELLDKVSKSIKRRDNVTNETNNPSIITVPVPNGTYVTYTNSDGYAFEDSFGGKGKS